MYTPTYYFAYGSNMNKEQMMRRCPTAEPIRPLVLRNWRLVFRNVADIEPFEGGRVLGALWRILPPDEEALDRYEGIAFGLYRKVDFRITATNQLAFMYVMNSIGLEAPSEHYYKCIEQGYRDFGHSTDVLAAARDHAVLEGTDWQQDDDYLFKPRRA